MTVDTWIGWDTETELIRPGVRAPRLVCLTACADSDARPSSPIEHWPAALHTSGGYLTKACPSIPGVPVASSHRDLFRLWLSDPTIGLVGANVAYDMCVMMQDDPNIVPLVFRAYNDNRVIDIQIRQKLLDIAAGRFRKEFIGARVIHYKYSLADVTKRLLGVDLSKPKFENGINTTPDHWRLRYVELIDTPLAQWDPGAISYALDDARATIGCKLAQDAHAPWLQDEHRKARLFMALDLMSAYGLRTNPIAVESFALEVEQEIAELQRELMSLGLVRADGTRDMKATARLMIEVCRGKGLEIVATKTAKKKIAAGFDFTPTYEDTAGVALDSDTCERADDPRLTTYSEYVTLAAVKSKDLVMLRNGATYPVHTRYDVAETGRTTSSGPNVQNIRRLPGIRECFVPRDGYVYMQADYPGLELKTLAQILVWFFGKSDLADALRAGKDPHLMGAANMLGISYEEAKRRKKDPQIKDARQLFKIANFGYAGGLGAETFIAFARQSKAILDVEKAKWLKQMWLATWPEMKLYFRMLGEMCERDGGEVTQVVHPLSNRIRGRVRFTALANGYFQGLGIDAASEALWDVAQECYLPSSGPEESPLFGARPCNFVHDEIIAEVFAAGDTEWRQCGACKATPCTEHRDDGPHLCSACKGRGWIRVSIRASLAAKRLARVMVDAANRWLPDVPFRHEEMEPTLMTHWSKNAAMLLDIDGNIGIWEG